MDTTFRYTGIASSQTNQSIASIRGLCLQNRRTRQKTWQSRYIYHVFANHHVEHIDATILFPSRLHQV